MKLAVDCMFAVIVTQPSRIERAGLNALLAPIAGGPHAARMIPRRAAAVAAALLALVAGTSAAAGGTRPRGRLLSRMTWMDANAALTPETVVVIPVGAESKEHGL